MTHLRPAIAFAILLFPSCAIKVRQLSRPDLDRMADLAMRLSDLALDEPPDTLQSAQGKRVFSADTSYNWSTIEGVGGGGGKADRVTTAAQTSCDACLINFSLNDGCSAVWGLRSNDMVSAMPDGCTPCLATAAQYCKEQVDCSTCLPVFAQNGGCGALFAQDPQAYQDAFDPECRAACSNDASSFCLQQVDCATCSVNFVVNRGCLAWAAQDSDAFTKAFGPVCLAAGCSKDVARVCEAKHGVLGSIDAAQNIPVDQAGWCCDDIPPYQPWQGPSVAAAPPADAPEVVYAMPPPIYAMPAAPGTHLVDSAFE